MLPGFSLTYVKIKWVCWVYWVRWVCWVTAINRP